MIASRGLYPAVTQTIKYASDRIIILPELDVDGSPAGTKRHRAVPISFITDVMTSEAINPQAHPRRIDTPLAHRTRV
eukprot:scaffold226542_cov19-Prasinocladus_malaysianus.AAC.1